MKYLLIIAVVLFAYSANAQTFNPVVTSGTPTTLTSNVIHPLTGDGIALTADNEVIKGQNRTSFAHANTVTFELNCEPHSNVLVNFYPPSDITPDSHVALSGSWFNQDNSPIVGTSKIYNLGVEESTIAFYYLITGIDATHPDVTTGDKHFKIYIDFSYSGI